jgi:Spy/CpxP family protein refolding chaperone
MNTNSHRLPTTRALKTPFSPRMKLALASGLLVLAAGLAPSAHAMAPAGEAGARHAQHQAGEHGKHHQGKRGMHGGMHMDGMGGMDMMGMGMGLGMGRHSERLLDSVGATAEQKLQIRQIGEAARADLKAQREAAAPLREQARGLMTQPNIDANAVEVVRQQMLAQHDQASRRMAQALVEMGRVLTPEQRQSLAERMAQRQTLMQQRRAEHMAAPQR